MNSKSKVFCQMFINRNELISKKKRFFLSELLNLNIVEFKSWEILNWFEWYNISHLFHDPIALFRQARMIIDPHDTEMMDILWSSIGTHIVEPEYINTGMIFLEIYAKMSLHFEQWEWRYQGYGDYREVVHVGMNDFTHFFTSWYF